jgi:adenylate kinase family enzyme
MRIHVTGNAGAGKTTLARKLGVELDLQVTHLDQIVWAPGWKKVPPHEREISLRKITQSENWIIEGVSEFVRHRADLVIFLDASRPECIWRCLKRNSHYLFKPRPELPSNCPEWRIWPKLVGIIWRFPGLVGDHIRHEASESSRYVVLNRGASADEWLQAFRAAA